MNLGNKLAVGEVVDLGTDDPVAPEEIGPEVTAVRVEVPEPVAAHAE